MRLLTFFALSTICSTAIGQAFPLKNNDSWYRVDTSFAIKDKRQKTLSLYPDTYIHTESKYTDSSGIVVTIQNSLPKGNGLLDASGKSGYTDPAGTNFGYVIFWTRVTNETADPLELTINFPADSFASFASPVSYFKLFLLPDTMTHEKVSMYDYGVTGLKSFLDTGFDKPTMLRRTINPKEDCLFYVAALSYQGPGVARAGFVLQGQELFYRTSFDSALIPCGQIVFKK